MSTDQQPQAAAAPPRPETSLVTSCHCQRIQVRLPSTPKILNECRCTVCYKYGALWASTRARTSRSASRTGPGLSRTFAPTGMAISSSIAALTVAA